MHARSPDPTPKDIFLSGHLKEQVCVIPNRTIECLLARFQAAARTVDANTLGRVLGKAMRSTAVCLEIDGGRFEQLLLTKKRHVLIS